MIEYMQLVSDYPLHTLRDITRAKHKKAALLKVALDKSLEIIRDYPQLRGVMLFNDYYQGLKFALASYK